ncbi:unnamed protein product, partial [Rotaria sp. Silwood2]
AIDIELVDFGIPVFNFTSCNDISLLRFVSFVIEFSSVDEPRL